MTHLLFEKLCRVENNKRSTTNIDALYHSSAEFQTEMMNWFCKFKKRGFYSLFSHVCTFAGRIDHLHPFEELYLIVMILLDATFM